MHERVNQKQSPEVFCKKEQNSQENICARVSGLRRATLLKKGTLAQVFFCVFCEIFNNTFFTENPRMTASGQCE